MVGAIAMGIYGVLLAAGGLVGYLKAGSRPSLIAGTISALAAFASLGLCLAGSRLGPALGLVLAIALSALFGYRYAIKTRKFMPSGMLAVVSLVVLLVMIGVIFSGGTIEAPG